MSLRTADYDYPLPDELIARYPAARRDESRMMLLDREKQQITHLRFGDFVDLVQPTELVVLNDTKVIPARIRFPDRNAEILLLEEVDPLTWRCLVRPGKSFSVGRTFSIEGQVGTVIQIVDEGDRLIRFDRPIDLDKIGEMPVAALYHTGAGGRSTVSVIKPFTPRARGRSLHRPPGCISRPTYWRGCRMNFSLCTWASVLLNR